MDTYQVTVYGWPDKRDGREPTRCIIPMDSKMARLTVTAIANRLGGLFQVDIKLIDPADVPKRENDEVLRAGEIVMQATRGDVLQ